MDTSQIILIVFIGVLLIAYPIMMFTRNKKDRQRMAEQTNSLKRGDKVLTTSGIYGTIVELRMEGEAKIVTIETGTSKNKGYISVDAYSIYTIIPDENGNVEEKPVEQVVSESENKIDLLQPKKSEIDKLLEREETSKKKTSKKKNG